MVRRIHAVISINNACIINGGNIDINNATGCF
jgi:hypothetical protein